MVDNWWRAARLQLTGPDGRVQHIDFTKGEASRPASQRILELEDGDEIEKSFSLEGRVRTREPGWYELSGVIESTAGRWTIPKARWFVETPRPMEVAIPFCRGNTDANSIPCWTLFHGERLTSLMLRKFARNDFSNAVGINVSTPERLHEPDPAAGRLVAMESPLAEPHSLMQWVAWLSGQKLHLGVPFAGFNIVSFDLPSAPLRIIPRLLAHPEGGVDTFVLRDDGRELWLVRSDPPVLAQAKPAEVSEEDPNEAPGSQVLMPAPQLFTRFVLPQAFNQGAVARGIGAVDNLTGIVFTIQHSSSVEVLYGAWRDDGSVPAWRSVHINQVILFRGADPAIVVDEQGIAHVAVIFHTAASGSDSGRIGVARMAFNPEGFPLWVEDIGRKDLGVLPGKPISAAIAFHVDQETLNIRADWCVLLQENVCFIGRGSSNSLTFKPRDTVVQPIALHSSLEYTAIATRGTDGALRFVHF
jgi:hypothetical protein